MRAGETTALIGPNGAGKTTLVWILSTVMSPSSGEIRYGDVEHGAACARLRSCIGVVSHSALVYPQLSAIENLELAASLFGVSKGRDRARLLLREAGLGETAWDRPTATYSAGMLQRVAVARALIHDPLLLLMDEPFAGLDREASEHLTEVLRGAHDRGKMILLATHDLDRAAMLADRTAVLVGGRVGRLIDEVVDRRTLASIYAGCVSQRRGRIKAANGEGV